MPLLELTGVEASYGPVKALHGVSLSVEEGQAVAILGANGAGKTTTLRAVSGTVDTSGEIVFDGQPDRAARRPRRSRGSGSPTCPRAAGSTPSCPSGRTCSSAESVRRDRKAVKADIDPRARVLPADRRPRASSRPGR